MNNGRQNTSLQTGFTLLEIMMVVAIIGILAASAVLSFSSQQKRAKRVEVTLGLDKIREAQYTFYLENGVYAGSFSDLLFKTSHGRQQSATVYKGDRYEYVLSQPWGTDSFMVVATGNIDGDQFPDVWVAEVGRE